MTQQPWSMFGGHSRLSQLGFRIGRTSHDLPGILLPAMLNLTISHLDLLDSSFLYPPRGTFHATTSTFYSLELPTP